MTGIFVTFFGSLPDLHRIAPDGVVQHLEVTASSNVGFTRSRSASLRRQVVTGMTNFFKSRVDFWQSYLIFYGPKKRNIRWFLTFKKEKNVQNFTENRSVRSLDRDKMRIISIWTIRTYDIRFVDKMLKSRVKKSGPISTFADLFLI